MRGREAAAAGALLTVDAGTSAVRVSAVSPAGALVTAASLPSREVLAGEEATLDADGLWTEVCTLLATMAGEVGQPLALCVAAQLGTVLVDEELNPVAPAFLWQDRRAAAETAELAAALGDRAAAVAGRRAAVELTAPRLLWTARHRPREWARARWVLSLKDFLVARLTGAVVTDPASASYTLLFDVSAGAWSEELLAAAGVAAERLPPVLAAGAAAGALDERAAAATGLDAGLPVAVGGPDGSMGALGSGAASPGVTVDVAGTTDVVLHTLDRPVADPERRSILNAFLLPGVWTVGGPTGLTGGAIAWLCGVLGHASVDDAYRVLGDAAAALPPGAEGVTFHTALTGERFPTWASGSAGSVSGLRPGHTAAHLLRAAEEGAAFEVRSGLEALAGVGVEVREIRMSGGSSRRRESMQLRANVWGRPVVGVSGREATTVGAAVLAAACGGVHGSVEDAVAAMVALDPATEPEHAAPAAYDEAYERWLAARGVVAR